MSIYCAIQSLLTHLCLDSVPFSPRVLRVPAEEGQVRPVRLPLTVQTLTQCPQMQSLARGEPPGSARQVLLGECVPFLDFLSVFTADQLLFLQALSRTSSPI